MVDGAGFLLVARPLELDDKAAKLLDAQRARLPSCRGTAAQAAARLAGAGAGGRQCAHMAEQTGAKLGKVAQPLRAALTGRTVSPPVFDVMAVLGRDEALARMKDQAA